MSRPERPPRVAPPREGAVASSDAAALRVAPPPLDEAVTVVASTPLVAARAVAPREPIPVLLRDLARRIWDHAAEDNLFFLAGAVAFNLLAALVPFALLLVVGLVWALGLSPDDSSREVATLVRRLLPPQNAAAAGLLERVVGDILRTRGAVTLWSVVTFAWLSTRLFGTLRSVLAEVFDIEQERGIVWGKLFDLAVTVVGSVCVVAYLVLSVYLGLATTRGVRLLAQWGVTTEVMGRLTYLGGRALAFGVLVATLFALFKWLPNRRIRWQTAGVAAVVAAALFEAARLLFIGLLATFTPGSLYTGTIAAVAIVVLWVYWAAILFIIGGEVAHAVELRRLRRARRVTLA